MPELSNIFDYMRLCGAPHKRIYVKMPVMLSWLTEPPFAPSFRAARLHNHDAMGFPARETKGRSVALLILAALMLKEGGLRPSLPSP